MTQKESDFDFTVNKTLEDIRELLFVKGKEYRRNNNPYHNFERGAEISNRTSEEVLQGFLLKHLISVEDIRNDSKIGIYPSIEKINEKYNDILVYYLIEKTMVIKKMEDYNNSLEKAKNI